LKAALILLAALALPAYGQALKEWKGGATPALELEDVEGKVHRLADYKGKVVLLNFWATWCAPCEEELPAMQRLHRELSGGAFELVAISVDADQAPVLEFRERMGLGFTLLLDSDQRVARSYQTFRFPETLLIGRDGVILERYVGPKDWDAPVYLDRIRRLLQERSGA
jgi:peroxiredoxin